MAVVGAAVSLLAPMWQEHSQHSEHMKLLYKMHTEAMRLNEEHFLEEQQLQNVLHRKELALERELHSWQLLHDNDIAKREAIRDVWSQKNQHIQTLMTIDTLMFSCAYAIIVQGDMAFESSAWLLRCNAVCQGISTSSLFISIWFCLNAQLRMSQYNIHHPGTVYHPCGKQHHRFLDFFRCHCAHVQRYAFITFYLGTAATVGNAAFFAYSKLAYEYGSPAAGAVFVAVACCAVLAPLVARFVGYVVDTGFFDRKKFSHRFDKQKTEDDPFEAEGDVEGQDEDEKELNERPDMVGDHESHVNKEPFRPTTATTLEAQSGIEEEGPEKGSFFYNKVYKNFLFDGGNEANPDWEEDVASVLDDKEFAGSDKGGAERTLEGTTTGPKQSTSHTVPNTGLLFANYSEAMFPSLLASNTTAPPERDTSVSALDEDVRSCLSYASVISSARGSSQGEVSKRVGSPPSGLHSFQTSKNVSALATPIEGSSYGENRYLSASNRNLLASQRGSPHASSIPMITITGTGGVTAEQPHDADDEYMRMLVARNKNNSKKRTNAAASWSMGEPSDAGGHSMAGTPSYPSSGEGKEKTLPASTPKWGKSPTIGNRTLNSSLFLQTGVPASASLNISPQRTTTSRSSSFALRTASHSSSSQNKQSQKEALEAGAEEPSSMLVGALLREVSGVNFTSSDDEDDSSNVQSKRYGEEERAIGSFSDGLNTSTRGGKQEVEVKPRRRKSVLGTDTNNNDDMLQLWRESLEETIHHRGA